jgi:hypothetical protein
MGLLTAVLGREQGWIIAAGALGPVLAAAYLMSPAWRLRVFADDEGLEIRRGDDIRLRLLWTEVVRVLVVPRWKVAFVDGGDPAKSFLLTGPGAPGPYRIERREALYDYILANVPAEKIEQRETLEGR